jgi:rhodanese-related sulfurtransferase
VFGRVPEISVEELNAKRERGESCVLLDVREPKEYAISDLPDSVKIPLGRLPNGYDQLSRDDEIVVYCRTGARSASAVQFLRGLGYDKARNLAGGINRWAEVVDPSMARY